MPADPHFIASVFEPDDLLGLRLIPSRKRRYVRAGKIAASDDWLKKLNAAGEHIYIGANPRRRQGGKAEDVALARCLFVDLDPDDGLRRIEDAGLPTPTCAVASGHGLHAWWRLAEPVTDLQAWSAAQRTLIGLLGSDPVIHDPARIMRLPGFVNHKKPPAQCRVIDADVQRRYQLHEIIPPGVNHGRAEANAMTQNCGSPVRYVMPG